MLAYIPMPMNLTRFVFFAVKHSKGMVWIMVGAGVLSGLLSAGVLALINSLLHQTLDQSWLLVLGFTALVAGKLLTGILSQLLMVRFTQNTIMDLSLKLCSKILQAPLRRAEERGISTVLLTLTDDVSSVTWAIQCFPKLAMNTAVIVGCGVYLAWLSWVTFLGVLLMTILGVVGYQWLHAKAFGSIQASRAAREEVFFHFRSLTEGLKELLMHKARRREFLDREVRVAADRYRQTNMDATSHYALAEAWTQATFYGLIGALIFVFPGMVQLSPEALTGYVVAVLYMMNPIWNVIGSLPAVGRGRVALENIERLGVSLEEEEMGGEEESPGVLSVLPPSRTVVEWNQVVFTYSKTGSGEGQFTLGPISIELRPGQLIFVIGGNGSGKSTFVKVLVGLYPPLRGEVRLAGMVVEHRNLEWYREHFSVVFTDFYLFKKLLGIPASDVSAWASKYLKLLHIDNKVHLHENSFSMAGLSQGQSKRLALITAYLEDRPIYVFDEWAADQDPQYKEIFYTRLLPDLRRRGKTVVVITHDDRYFHLGDQIIKLEDGKVVEAWKPESGRGYMAGVAR